MMKGMRWIPVWLIGLFLVGMSGCEGFTTNEPSQILLPGPPRNLRATALDTNTIKFKWEISEDVGVLKHYAYKLQDSKFRTIDSGTFDPNQTEYVKTDLQLGEVYTLTMYSVSSDTIGPWTRLSWSPAMIFKDIEGEPIRLTPKQPGLQFFNALLGAPAPLDTNGKLDWDVVVDFLNPEKAILRSPKNYPPYLKDSVLQKTLKSASFAEEVILGAPSVDEIYRDKSLSSTIFTDKSQNLNKYTQNVAFIVKVISKDGQVHFAKLLFKAVNGSIVQGSGDERYVECEIAYQPTPGVPYARTQKAPSATPTP